MDLVDDVDLELGPRGREVYFLQDRPHVVNAVVGSGVHLDYVKDGTVKDSLAGRALVAGIAVYGMLAVDCPGKDLGDGGLAGAVLAAEKICMRETAGDDRLAECSDGSLLSDDVIKS